MYMLSELTSFQHTPFRVELFQHIAFNVFSMLASLRKKAFSVGFSPEEGFQCWLLSRRRLSVLASRRRLSVLASLQKKAFNVGFQVFDF